MKVRRILVPAALWALVGSLTGVLVWSFLAATFWRTRYASRHGIEEVTDWLATFLASGIWAAVVGFVAFPVYTVLFAVWLAAFNYYPNLRPSLSRPWLVTLLLGTPPALLLAWGNAESPMRPFDWAEATTILGLALPSWWLGVWLPRRWLRSLKAAFDVTAG